MKPWQEVTLWGLSLALVLAGAALIWWAWQPAMSGGSELQAAAAQAMPTATATPVPAPTLPPVPTPTPTGPPATATPVAPIHLALPEAIADGLSAGLQDWLAGKPGRDLARDGEAATLWLDTTPEGGAVLERVFVPVTRFASLRTEIEPPALLALWLGEPPDGEPPLIVDADSAAWLRVFWGEPASAEIVADTAAVAAGLEESPNRLGIVLFDRLIPRLNAVAVDGNDPTDNRFDPNAYPLTLRLYLHEDGNQQAERESLAASLKAANLHTNRDPGKLTVLAMTGVTAMSRMTAYRMEQNGNDYPAQVVGPELAAADLTHISNEVPFVADCQVNITENNITLCSRPEYLEALRAVGVDLVGLTGNHLNDFGREASLASLKFYADEGLPTYGGGVNDVEAAAPLIMEHNGNRLAFLGANSFGPQLAWAEADWPGSAPYSLEAMRAAIADIRDRQLADLVLVELQWEESYDTLPIQSQVGGFRQISAAGADIVTGVQSHVPQAVAFGEGGMILYGLGNLFFDQMWSLPTRQGLIPRHTIYDGRHLSTELLTTILEDFAQPRWASEAEREVLLTDVFTASGW